MEKKKSKLFHWIMFIIASIGVWLFLITLWNQPIEQLKIVGMFTILGYIAWNKLFG